MRGVMEWIRRVVEEKPAFTDSLKHPARASWDLQQEREKQLERLREVHRAPLP